MERGLLEVCVLSLPTHLKHFQHSRLFTGLVESMDTFYKNKIIDDSFVERLVPVFASEFEKAFDRYPVNSKSLEIAEDASIVNYRFDRGYWEIVIPETTVMISDQSNGRSCFFRDAVSVKIEGSGGGMRKGKRKSESIKRAHTRQVAKDTRWEGSSDEEDEEEEDSSYESDEDTAWKP